MEKQVVQVEVKFLQQILNYLSTRPYGEVHELCAVLLGKPSEYNVKEPVSNIEELG